MLGPFATASRRTPIHQVSLPVLSHAACASMSTTTTTTRDRGDRYGPMEWAQLVNTSQPIANYCHSLLHQRDESLCEVWCKSVHGGGVSPLSKSLKHNVLLKHAYANGKTYRPSKQSETIDVKMFGKKTLKR